MIPPNDIHNLLEYARFELQELREQEPELARRWVPILAHDVRELHNELRRTNAEAKTKEERWP